MHFSISLSNLCQFVFYRIQLQLFRHCNKELFIAVALSLCLSAFSRSLYLRVAVEVQIVHIADWESDAAGLLEPEFPLRRGRDGVGNLPTRGLKWAADVERQDEPHGVVKHPRLHLSPNAWGNGIGELPWSGDAHHASKMHCSKCRGNTVARYIFRVICPKFSCRNLTEFEKKVSRYRDYFPNIDCILPQLSPGEFCS